MIEEIANNLSPIEFTVAAYLIVTFAVWLWRRYPNDPNEPRQDGF